MYLVCRLPPAPLFPYTTLFRSGRVERDDAHLVSAKAGTVPFALEHANHLKPVGADTDELIERIYFAEQHALHILADDSYMCPAAGLDRKSTRLNSSHRCISYAVFRLLHSFPTRRSSDLAVLSGMMHILSPPKPELFPLLLSTPITLNRLAPTRMNLSRGFILPNSTLCTSLPMIVTCAPLPA